MKRLPTASNLARASRCPASEVLPHIASSSPASTRGTTVHRYLEQARKVGQEAALAEVDDEDVRTFCAALPLDQLPAGGSHEVALAWDYETDLGRELPVSGHRDYAAAAPTEFVGTADYVGRDGAGLVVIDYKTGYRYLGPAAESHQLRMLALAAARAYDADAVTVGYCFLREDGSYSFSWADFDAFDLAEIADELRDLVERLERKSGSTSLIVHQGDWCDFCPAFESCPAKIRLARAIGSGDAMVQLSDFERQVEAMTSGELARAYEMLEQFDDVANRVRKALKQRAAMRPIDLDDGRRLGAVPWPFTCVKADIAYATVRELHGEEAAERACPRKATLGALKELGGDTLAEVERRRGIVCGSKPQVRVHRP